MANLFLTGGGVPTNAVGEVTDYYRDTATNLIYYRAALGWEVVPSLVPTPDGVGTNWLFGTGAPDNGIGSANDYYRDDANGIIYRKHITSGWEAKGELDFIGVYGVQWGEGTGAPANIPSLNNLPAGSFYLDVATSDIYYKDNTLTWSLKGQLGGGGGGGGGVTVVQVIEDETDTVPSSAVLFNLDLALSDKANLDSPAFTGTPTAPTPDSNDDSTALATTEFVHDVVNAKVAGLLDDRGNYNPTATSAYPTAANNGSGAAGAILKGDLWAISAGGTMGGITVTIGDTVRALVDAPAQTASNWAIIQNNTPVVQSYADNDLPLASSVAINTEVFNTTYQVKMRSNGTDWEWLGIGKSTWANKPSVAPSGQIICITDVGENGSLWRGDGTKWVRLNPIKIFSLSAPVFMTGSSIAPTSVVTLATITIPAGLMGANGKLKIYPLWATTNNANIKTLRAVFSGSTCTTMTSQSVSNNSGLVIIRNTNSESAQKCSSGLVAGIGASYGSIASPTVDTSAATTITITGQLAVGTDTLTLEDLFVEVV